jgi:hypothetical protein
MLGGGCTNTRVDSAGWCGNRRSQSDRWGAAYLAVYLTLAPIFSAVEKQDILNLRTLLGGKRIVLVNPVFDYESKVLSALKRK